MVELTRHGFGIWISPAVVLRVDIKALCIARISYVRLNRWANPTMIERFPVDAVKEWMRLDLLGTTTNVS
jgi:hypothetical protein